MGRKQTNKNTRIKIWSLESRVKVERGSHVTFQFSYMRPEGNAGYQVGDGGRYDFTRVSEDVVNKQMPATEIRGRCCQSQANNCRSKRSD